MEYTKQTFYKGQRLTADQLNYIENGIEQLAQNVADLAENLGGESLNTVISTHNIDASAHADIRAQLENFVLNIDYEHLLAFDTNEVVISAASVAIIGQAMLGRMILA